jgi:hypothetical protein
MIISAATIDDLAAIMSEEIYEALDGVYVGHVPTWGPKTAEVEQQIRASCAEGDFVSWDTRQEPHRYLCREHAAGRETFRVVVGE